VPSVLEIVVGEILCLRRDGNLPPLVRQPLQVRCNQEYVKATLLLLILLAASLLASAQTVAPDAGNRAALPQAPSASIQPYQPITGKRRIQWFLQSTVGPNSLAVGVLSAGIGTARDAPKEYGPHWDGFAKRYGMRLTGVSTGNLMEAGLGTLWGEDPRYFRSYHQPFKGRVKTVVGMTFLAHNRHGQITPAYARYIATPGNNFLSNSWRADSEATVSAAALRTLLGFVGLMSKNAFAEFWPDAQHLIFHKKQ
jgi:hypothetical protein